MPERDNQYQAPKKGNFSRRKVREQYGLDEFDDSEQRSVLPTRSKRRTKVVEPEFSQNPELEALLMSEAPIVTAPIPQPLPEVFIMKEIYGGANEILIPNEFFTSRAEQELKEAECLKEQRLITFRRYEVGQAEQKLGTALIQHKRSAIVEINQERLRVTGFEQRLGMALNAVLPVIEDIPVKREGLEALEFRLLRQESEIAVRIKEAQDETKRKEVIMRDYRNYAREWMTARLTNKPIGNKLRLVFQRLDSAVAEESLNFRLDCLKAFAEGLGVKINPIDEVIEGERYKYIDKISKSKDPATLLIDSIAGEHNITQAAFLFLKAIIDLQSHEQNCELEVYLKDAVVNKNILKERWHLPKFNDSRGLSFETPREKLARLSAEAQKSQIVVALEPLLLEYAKWLSIPA